MLRSSSGSRFLSRALRAVLHNKNSYTTESLLGRSTSAVTVCTSQRLYRTVAGAKRQSVHPLLLPNHLKNTTIGHVRFYSLPSYTKIELPALSPTMETGTIASWVVKEGDRFEPGDLLAEIETDKATVGFEAQDDGYIARILMPEGSKDVALGTPIAIAVDNEEDVASFKDFTLDSGPPSPSETISTPVQQPAAPPSASKSYPRHERIVLPALSPTMTTGTIAKWAVKVGDKVEEGDLLADIETDKATMAMEAEDEGYIAKILLEDGAKDISLGTLLCIKVENQEDVAAFADFVDVGEEAPPVISAAPTPTAPPSISPPTPQSTLVSKDEGRVFASPLAKKLAREKSLDLSQIRGSGPGGRIRAQDLTAVPDTIATRAPGVSAPAPSTVPLAEGDFVDIPLSNIRKVTAKRLLESKQNIPHYYLTIDCNIDKLKELRQQFNDELQSEGVKLSVNDFIVKAAALSCLKVPEANSSWQETFIRQHNVVDMSVAVSTDTGLITPIIFNAHTKGLSSIAQDVVTLAARAREGKLQPNEFMGGTFTISNLGMFGIKQFTAIINPPQSCILAVGSAREEFVPDENAESGMSVASVMSVTLSCDHRVVDGAVGARWLQHFRKYIEKPSRMLL